MFRRVTAALSVAVLLAACTQSGSDKNEPTAGLPAASDPVLAYVLQTEDILSTTRILSKGKHRDVKGFVHDVLPNGSILIDRNIAGDVDKPAYPVIVDPATGEETVGKNTYDANNGNVGFGRDSILVGTDDGKQHVFAEFGLDFKKIRQVTLPGRSGSGLPGDGRYSAYGAAVRGDGAVFIARSEWKNVDSVSDSVMRLDDDGELTTVLKDRHIDEIFRASDGTLLASRGESGPYYEGGPPLADIVELDASTGKIARSYGLPEPCADFEPVFDDASCVDRLDKVGGTVAAVVYESRKPADGLDGFSTWRYADGAWTEVKSQRNHRVVWQSHSTRIQQQVDPASYDENPKTYPIEWVEGDQVSEVPGTSELGSFDWFAPGSLIRP